MGCFTEEQYALCRDGLLDGFPGRIAMANLLRAVAATPRVAQYPRSSIARKLKNINQMVGEESDLDKIVYIVLQQIEASNLCHELVHVAHQWNPFEPSLTELYQQFQYLPLTDPSQQAEFEGLIHISKEQFQNPSKWVERFGPIEYRVCRVEKGKRDETERKGFGTGFLVAPDLVLTNHHVIESVLEDGWTNPQELIFGFDRKEGAEYDGPEYGLKNPLQQEEWLLAVSDKYDLDYALVCLDKPAGDQAILRNADGGNPQPRGYLKVSPTSARALRSNDSLFIWQHPDAMTLKIDFGSVARVDHNKHRVTYNTSTMPGSSGSPCFDRGLKLAALHHVGLSKTNEAVLIDAIVADLNAKGVGDRVTIEE